MTESSTATRPVAGTHRRLCDALASLGGPQIFLHDVAAQGRVGQAEPTPPRGGARRHSLTAATAETEETKRSQRSRARSSEPSRYAALLSRQPGALPGQAAPTRAHCLRFFSAAEGASVAARRNTLHPDTCPCCVALKAAFFQVVKESVVAFRGCRLYAQLLQHPAQPGDVEASPIDSTTATVRQHHPLPGSGAPSSTSRQAALRCGVEAYLRAVAQQEETLVKASAACTAHIGRLRKGAESAGACASTDRLPVLPRHLLFAQLPHIPLQRWAGAQLYNGWHVRCRCGAAPPMASATKRTGTAAAAPPPTAPGTSAPPPPPKPLALPTDVEQELRRYWKLHDEANARARLDALRCNDAEAFAQHVSLLKVSALLSIMERTEGFMRRIGLRLQAQAGLSERGLDGAAPPLTHTLPGHTSEYERFRAYVASTKNEFKLMHRVDAFVAAQPPGLEATLLPHQMDGLRFLVSLDANKINGILADEMGVGKTIQTLAFLLHLKHQRTSLLAHHNRGGGAAPGTEALSARPHLVLAPLSVIREWREACEQFVPLALRVALFQKLPDPAHDAAQYDLVLLPIHAVRHVAAEAARVPWHYLVVDEAHKAVANLRTITAQCILGLPCRRRLVLTGTPLSSDLQELWSLLHFLNPHVFTDNDAFEEVFRRPFRVYGAQEMELTEEERGLLILRLHQVLRPFLLRRTKADVDASLRMSFHHVWCPMSAVQQRLLCLLRGERRTPAMLTGTRSSSTSGTSSDNEESVEAAAASAAAAADQAAGEPSCARATHALQTDTSAALPVPAADPVTCDFGDAGSDVDALDALVRRHLSGLAAQECDGDLCRAVQADKALGLSNAGVSESAAQLVCNHAFLLPFFSQVLHRHGLDELAHEMGTATDRGEQTRSSLRRDGAAGATADPTTRPRGAAGVTLACSSKFLVLHLLLSRLYAAGRKAVLFTHWLDCVDLLAEYLQSRGYGPHTEVLTGASSEAERRASVRRFREDPTCFFFVLSIKAGGCGINLQAAHMVVLLDRDYTATNEDQALARVYRIGQRHTVRAVYLSTDDVSEQRVAQRAAEKNKPREAIINAGVYQLREAAATEEVQPSEVQHVRSDPLWQCVPERASLSCAADDVAGTSVAAEPFWAALAHFVDELDELVLTEEDRAVLAHTEKSAEARGSAAEAAGGAAARLRAARPPATLEELRRLLEPACEDAAAASATPSGAAAETRTRRAEGALGRGAGDIVTLAESERLEEEAGAAGGCPGQARDASRGSAASPPASPPRAAPLPATSPGLRAAVAVPNPLHHRALFWLEYVHLLRMAQRGPRLLVAAVDAAVHHDAAREDPAALARRRRRRDRRAAKRLRLASLDVPDAFREACWAEHGIDDDAEVAARYARHVDALARRGPAKRPRRRRLATPPPLGAATGEERT